MPDANEQLLAEARRAASFGYAPYSGVLVGAAVRAGHAIHTGANVENTSFALSVCAERVAIFKAVSAGEKQIDAVAVATLHSPAQLPCGACRQVMNEFAAKS